MVWDLLQIDQDNTFTSGQKLEKVQNIVQNEDIPPVSIHFVSNIFEDCVKQDQTKCLETAYLITEEVNGLLNTDIERGLEAIGEENISVVNQFIKQQIQSQDLETAYNLSTLVPYLYRGQENNMAVQMPDWYNIYSDFFFRALKDTLRAFLEDSSGHGAEDFSNELDPIKSKLEAIAQSEGLDPNDAYQDKDYKVIKVSILMNDLKWVTKNIVDWRTIQSNLTKYSHLESLLNFKNNPISDLQQHNTHPLTKLLRLDHSDKLAYYDHSTELITPKNGQNSDSNADLRDYLLSRERFSSTIAEIEVFNVLRREFGVDNVAIEEPINNAGVADAKITTGGETIWVEVTHPRPQPSYEVAKHYTISMSPEESKARGTVTNKLRKQIRDVKDETRDLTMLVIKNEESKVDDEIVGDYVEGFTTVATPQDDPDANPIIFTADSGLQYDNVPDHLDILANYDTLHDLSESPYTEGQIANLTDIDQSVIDQLVNAFNADELTPP